MSRTFHLFLVILAALGLTALFLIVLPAQQRTLASTQAAITVNTLQDEDYTDGDCSLREAIRAANENMEVDNCPAGDVISDTILFAFSGRIVLNA
jgi:CSLREA domain-containing protein